MVGHPRVHLIKLSSAVFICLYYVFILKEQFNNMLKEYLIDL